MEAFICTTSASHSSSVTADLLVEDQTIAALAISLDDSPLYQDVQAVRVDFW